MSENNDFSQEEVSGEDSKKEERSPTNGPVGKIGSPESEKKF